MAWASERERSVMRTREPPAGPGSGVSWKEWSVGPSGVGQALSKVRELPEARARLRSLSRRASTCKSTGARAQRRPTTWESPRPSARAPAALHAARRPASSSR